MSDRLEHAWRDAFVGEPGSGHARSCPDPSLARWDSCPHEIPEPDWLDGHVPTVEPDGETSCSCGWPTGGIRTRRGAFGGDLRSFALTNWESGHLPDELGVAGMRWVVTARRRLSAAHGDAINARTLR